MIGNTTWAKTIGEEGIEATAPTADPVTAVASARTTDQPTSSVLADEGTVAEHSEHRAGLLRIFVWQGLHTSPRGSRAWITLSFPHNVQIRLGRRREQQVTQRGSPFLAPRGQGRS
ncbi:hypothetical protein AB0926_08125 [Streptomyces griseoincarnatus]